MRSLTCARSSLWKSARALHPADARSSKQELAQLRRQLVLGQQQAAQQQVRQPRAGGSDRAVHALGAGGCDAADVAAGRCALAGANAAGPPRRGAGVRLAPPLRHMEPDATCARSCASGRELGAQAAAGGCQGARGAGRAVTAWSQRGRRRRLRRRWASRSRRRRSSAPRSTSTTPRSRSSSTSSRTGTRRSGLPLRVPCTRQIVVTCSVWRAGPHGAADEHDPAAAAAASSRAGARHGVRARAAARRDALAAASG